MEKKLLLFIPLALIILYFVGPIQETPELNTEIPKIKLSGTELEDSIRISESQVSQLKPDNEARIIWYDSTHKKTPYSIVYLHGFGASQAEGAPIHTDLANTFGCNLYLSRLSGHGISGDSVFSKLTPESLLNSAKRAVAIGREIGDSVIVMATSTGASMGLYLASENPDIKALVIYSPLIKLYDPSTYIIDKHWARPIMRMVVGSDYIENEETPEMDQYWTTKYLIDGLIDLKLLIRETMVDETYEKVKCPVFMGYYYKNDSLQDHVVSVPAMLDMFEKLGTNENDKIKQAFPEAGRHVIASYLKSGDWKGVKDASKEFLGKYVPVASVDTTSYMSSESSESTIDD